VCLSIPHLPKSKETAAARQAQRPLRSVKGEARRKKAGGGFPRRLFELAAYISRR
jgi:hypothetical protein